MGTETRYFHLPSDHSSDNMWCSHSRHGYSRGYSGESVCSLYRTECDWDNRIRIPDYSVLETGDRDAFDSNESAYWSDLDKYEMRLPSLPEHEEYEACNATLESRTLNEELLLKEIEKINEDLIYERTEREQTIRILSERNRVIQRLNREKTDVDWEIDKLERTNRRQRESLKNFRKEIVDLEKRLSTEELRRQNFENETNKKLEIQEAEHIKVETELKQKLNDYEWQLNHLGQENSELFKDLTVKEDMLKKKENEYNKDEQYLKSLEKQIKENEDSIRKLSKTNSELEYKVQLLQKDKKNLTEKLLYEEETKRIKQSQETLRSERVYQELRTEIFNLRLKIKEELLQKKTSKVSERKESISMRQILPQIDFQKSSNKAIEEIQRQLLEERLEIQQLLQDKDTLIADLKKHQKKGDQMQREIGLLRGQNELIRKQLAQEKETAKMKESLQNIITRTQENISAGEVQKQLSKENNELQRKIEQLLHDKKNLAVELRYEKETEKTKNSHDISKQQDESRHLQKEVDRLRNDNQILNKKLGLEQENVHLKEQTLNSMQHNVRTQREEISRLKAEVEVQKQLSEENTELQRKIEQLLQDKKNLAEELRYEKETEKKKKSHDILKQQDESRNLQKEVDRLRHDNQILNKKLVLEQENFNLKEQTLNSMQHNVKIQREEISRLKAEVENERQMNFEHQINVRKLLQENQDLEKELTNKREIEESTENYRNTTFKGVGQTLHDDVTKLRLQNQLLNDSLRQEKEKVKQMEKDTKVTYSDMQKQMEVQASEILTLKQKLKEISAQNSKADPRVSKNQGLDQDMQKRLDDAMAQVRHLQKELNDTQSRLSRAMGDKLTDNNPNIADLSDKNRPTKLSERYQELYDNQWTDAFEIINATIGNEGNTINVLRIILMDALEYCKTQAAYQMNQIKETFLKGEELPANMMKQVKECRKAMAELYGKGLYRDYCDQLRKSKSEKALHAIKTPLYVKECFEVCWLMAVQDPPVVFGTDIRNGDTFNKDHYKAYTKSGERVDFVVWPVLLLHQNGPVLCKGVAQGK